MQYNTYITTVVKSLGGLEYIFVIVHPIGDDSHRDFPKDGDDQWHRPW